MDSSPAIVVELSPESSKLHEVVWQIASFRTCGCRLGRVAKVDTTVLPNTPIVTLGACPPASATTGSNATSTPLLCVRRPPHEHVGNHRIRFVASAWGTWLLRWLPGAKSPGTPLGVPLHPSCQTKSGSDTIVRAHAGRFRLRRANRQSLGVKGKDQARLDPG